MGLVANLLGRLGFVRLRDYGLVMTQEGRVLTTRSAVLDDGFGGIVVGWLASDLAGAELATWSANPPAPRSAPKPIAVPAKSSPRPVPPPVPTAAARESEDEWEWEIAMAHARAASEVVALPSAAARRRLRNQPRSTSTVATSIPQPPGSTPRTIIPVPTLPAAVDPRRLLAFDDTRRLPPAPRRFPSATSQRAAAANDDDGSPTVVVPRATAHGRARV